MTTITLERVNELLEYRDGQLFWKVHPRGRKLKGLPSGNKDSKGYLQTTIDGRLHFNHRLIFLMHHGHLPTCVDHIDGNPANNRIENLREASRRQNSWNQARTRNTASGVKGVTWQERNKKWKVRVMVSGVSHYCGLFEDIELAELVAEEARNKYHGEFARHE